MRIMVTSIVAVVVLAVAAGLILAIIQKPTYEARALPTVRIDDPGHNLVGSDWSGLYKSLTPKPTSQAPTAHQIGAASPE